MKRWQFFSLLLCVFYAGGREEKYIDITTTKQQQTHITKKQQTHTGSPVCLCMQY